MTAALTWARLSYRQQRWELLLAATGVGIVAAVMLFFANELRSLQAAGPNCVGLFEYPPSCAAIATRFAETSDSAQRLLLLSFAAPFGMGVILGAPLVAREIEGGTAQLAWTLGRSRAGWLLRRIAFVALVTVALLAVLAVTSELLAAALAPDRSLGEDFIWSGRRGWLIVARGIGALGVGILVGAIVGRVLPAILGAALIIGLAFTAISLGQEAVLRIEAEPQRVAMGNASGAVDPGALVIDFGLELPGGEIVTWQEAQARGLVATVIDEEGRQFASAADMRAGRVLGYDIQLTIPSSRYLPVVAREAGVVSALGLFALVGTALVVSHRRPA